MFVSCSFGVLPVPGLYLLVKLPVLFEDYPGPVAAGKD